MLLIAHILSVLSALRRPSLYRSLSLPLNSYSSPLMWSFQGTMKAANGFKKNTDTVHINQISLDVKKQKENPSFNTSSSAPLMFMWLTVVFIVKPRVYHTKLFMSHSCISAVDNRPLTLRPVMLFLPAWDQCLFLLSFSFSLHRLQWHIWSVPLLLSAAIAVTCERMTVRCLYCCLPFKMQHVSKYKSAFSTRNIWDLASWDQ